MSGYMGCQYRGDDCIDMSGKETDWCTLFPKQSQATKYRKKAHREREARRHG